MKLTEGLVGTVDVPFERLPALNKSKDHPWFYSEDGGVLAGLEVFHSLHCLDMVRHTLTGTNTITATTRHSKTTTSSYEL
jgi:hypothetical protein